MNLDAISDDARVVVTSFSPVYEIRSTPLRSESCNQTSLSNWGDLHIGQAMNTKLNMEFNLGVESHTHLKNSCIYDLQHGSLTVTSLQANGNWTDDVAS